MPAPTARPYAGLRLRARPRAACAPPCMCFPNRRRRSRGRSRKRPDGRLAAPCRPRGVQAASASATGEPPRPDAPGRCLAAPSPGGPIAHPGRPHGPAVARGEPGVERASRRGRSGGRSPAGLRAPRPRNQSPCRNCPDFGRAMICKGCKCGAPFGASEGNTTTPLDRIQGGVSGPGGCDHTLPRACACVCAPHLLSCTAASRTDAAGRGAAPGSARTGVSPRLVGLANPNGRLAARLR